MLTGGVDEFFARSDGCGTQSYMTDALGSSLVLTEAAGALSTPYAYEAHGNTTESDNPFRFAGRENDGTGLLQTQELASGLLGGSQNLMLECGLRAKDIGHKFPSRTV